MHIVLAALALTIAVGTAAIAVAFAWRHYHQTTASVAAPSVALVPSTAAPADPPMVNAAEAWVRANVTVATSVVGDAQVVSDLQADGYQGAMAPGPSWGRARYLVLTPVISIRAASEPDVAAMIAGSKPVASYAGGYQQVQVRIIPATGVNGLAAAVARDATARRTAGPQLLSNPRVTVDPASAGVLSRGMLDLRAATFIALLSTRDDVNVGSVVVDPAETAAGLPSRALEIRVGDSAAIALTLQQLPPPYRPTSVAGTGTDAELRWPVAMPPVSTAG